MSKVIAVFGATGVQGGGVVSGLLKNKKFSVRAVTRNAQSEKVKALEKQGVEVVQGNLNEPATLPNAVSGCYGVFGVTNFWDPDVSFDMSKEIQQGKNLVDACKTAGVKHLVFSGLPDVKAAIGKTCPHFDGKAEIEKYAFASGVPTTSVRYPGYMENFLGFFKNMMSKTDDGTFVLRLPMEGKPVNILCAVGAGNAVAGVFDAGDTYIGKTIGLTGDKLTVEEFADIFNKHLAPKKFKAGEVTTEQFAKFGFPGADDLAVMFEFYQRGNPDHDLELTKKLDPTTLNFEDWVKQNTGGLNALFQ